jgi:hypothetical protein
MTHWRAPSFRVGMRIFCLMPPGEPRTALKLDRDDQPNSPGRTSRRKDCSKPRGLSKAREVERHGFGVAVTL